jgi:hypothetical protein
VEVQQGSLIQRVLFGSGGAYCDLEFAVGSGGDHFDPEFAVRVRLCCSGPALALAVEARRRKEEEGGRRRKEEEGKI